MLLFQRRVRSWETTIVGLLCLAGCGSGVTELAGSPRRSARQACRQLGFPDAIIDYGLNFAEAGRDAGFDEITFIISASEGCLDDPEGVGGCVNNPNVGVSLTLQECVVACRACITAIAREVWR